MSEWDELDARFDRMHRRNLGVEMLIAVALLVTVLVMVAR